MQAEPTLTLRMERTFDATPQETWNAWTDPRQIAAWWNPSATNGAEVHEADARVGGRLHLTMRVPETPSSTGADTPPVRGAYLLVDPPRERHMSMVEEWGDPGSLMPDARFDPVGARTRTRSGPGGTPASKEAPHDGMEAGRGACFDPLAMHPTRRNRP